MIAPTSHTFQWYGGGRHGRVLEAAMRHHASTFLLLIVACKTPSDPPDDASGDSAYVDVDACGVGAGRAHEGVRERVGADEAGEGRVAHDIA